MGAPSPGFMGVPRPPPMWLTHVNMNSESIQNREMLVVLEMTCSGTEYYEKYFSFSDMDSWEL